MEIKQYDRVILKDGRKAQIIEVFEAGVAYLADVDILYPDGSMDWETIDVKQEDIEKVVP